MCIELIAWRIVTVQVLVLALISIAPLHATAQEEDTTPEDTTSEDVTPEESSDVQDEVPLLDLRSNVPGATVIIDGEEVGQMPLEGHVISAGPHRFNVTAQGYGAIERTFSIVAGVNSIFIELTPSTATGRIVVRADIPGRAVSLNGQPQPSVLTIVEEAPPGPNQISLEVEGFQTQRLSCDVVAGQDCIVEVELQRVRVPLRVDGRPRRATVSIDGSPVGELPFEGDVEVGIHILQVSAEEMISDISFINVAPAQEGAPPIRPVRVYLEMDYSETPVVSVYGADTLPPRAIAVDMSGGWPFVFSLGFAFGIHRFVDMGFFGRTYGRLTEIELNGTFGYNVVANFFLGARLRVGGGFGSELNSLRGAAEFLMSYRVRNRVSFDFIVAIDMSSDYYPFSAVDHRQLLPYVGGDYPRQNMLRLRLGFSLQFAINRKVGVFMLVEYIPLDSSVEGQVETTRRVYGDVFSTGIPDQGIYGSIGLRFQYNVGGR